MKHINSLKKYINLFYKKNDNNSPLQQDPSFIIGIGSLIISLGSLIVNILQFIFK